MLKIRWLVFLALLLWLPRAGAQNTNAFELRDGDRVALLGDSLIAREEHQGYLEFLLTTHFPGRQVTCRNFGWSGETSPANSGAAFAPPPPVLDRLQEQLAAFKPTVAFLGYGLAGSSVSPAAVPRFTAEVDKLMEAVRKAAGGAVRFVLLSPPPREPRPPFRPDATQPNEQIAPYAQALREIAARHNAHFVSLFELLDNSRWNPPGPPLTEDGMRLSAYGYQRAAEALAMGLRWEPHIWQLGVTKEGKLRENAFGAKVLELEKQENRVRLVTLEEQLVSPLRPEDKLPLAAPPCILQVVGIQPGKYEFKIDGRLYRIVTDVDLRSALRINRGPQFDQAEDLRQAILKKNELFRQSWQPQSSTNQAGLKTEPKSPTKTDPSLESRIKAAEEKIARLRQPAKHTFELSYAADQSDPVPQSRPKLSPVPTPAPLRQP